MAERYRGTKITPLDGSYYLKGREGHALVTPGLEVDPAVVDLSRGDVTLVPRLTSCLQRDLARVITTTGLANRPTFRQQILADTIADLELISKGKRPLKLEIDY